MKFPTPIWVLAGLDQMTYRDLSWPEKKKLIVRHQGIRITPIENWAPKIIPEKYENHPFGRLFFVYVQDQALQKFAHSLLNDRVIQLHKARAEMEERLKIAQEAAATAERVLREIKDEIRKAS